MCLFHIPQDVVATRFRGLKARTVKAWRVAPRAEPEVTDAR
jgi:hypothetical protein